MKKFFCLILAALAAMTFSAAAEAPLGDAATIPPLHGTIIEINAEGIWLKTEEYPRVLVLVNKATELEGVEEELTPGQYVWVTYDGKMTRSLPPQVTAEKIALYQLRGEVIDLMEGSALVLLDGEGGEVLVSLPEDAPRLFKGCRVTLYTDGVMTASLPPLTNAFHVEVETVRGEIQCVGAASFTILAEGGVEYAVNIAPKTVLELKPVSGAQATVYFSGAATRSLPPQISAIAVIEQ